MSKDLPEPGPDWGQDRNTLHLSPDDRRILAQDIAGMIEARFRQANPGRDPKTPLCLGCVAMTLLHTTVLVEQWWQPVERTGRFYLANVFGDWSHIYGRLSHRLGHDLETLAQAEQEMVYEVTGEPRPSAEKAA